MLRQCLCRPHPQPTNLFCGRPARPWLALAVTLLTILFIVSAVGRVHRSCRPLMMITIIPHTLCCQFLGFTKSIRRDYKLRRKHARYAIAHVYTQTQCSIPGRFYQRSSVPEFSLSHTHTYPHSACALCMQTNSATTFCLRNCQHLFLSFALFSLAILRTYVAQMARFQFGYSRASFFYF